MIEHLMQEVQKLWSIKDAAPDGAQRIYEIDINGDFYVNLYFWEAKQRAVLFTNIYEVSEQKRLAVFETVLCGNVFGLGTDGFNLGYDRDKSMIILSAQQNIDSIDARNLIQLIEQFANTAGKWIIKLIELFEEKSDLESQEDVKTSKEGIRV